MSGEKGVACVCLVTFCLATFCLATRVCHFLSCHTCLPFLDVISLMQCQDIVAHADVVFDLN